MKKFAVRPLEREDISHIVDYWVNAAPEHLLAMGADITKVPEAYLGEASRLFVDQKDNRC